MKLTIQGTTISTFVCSAILLVANGATAGLYKNQAKPTFTEATTFLTSAAKEKRAKVSAKTFEEFKASVYKESFPGGKYIVNGDTTISNEKLLREFFEKHIMTEPSSELQGVELIVHQVGGIDAVWSSSNKKQLTYCISTEFDYALGQRYYQKVVQDMATATNKWEAVANVDFIHVSSEDRNCNQNNTNVVFDVRPVSGGEYLARAFFPNEPRLSRNLLIDKDSFDFNPNEKLQLVGVLRHELGHTLGFRHEHTRPEAGKCFEDQNWRPLGDYDPFSVMHYPQCNGQGDWSLDLTVLDEVGAACLYGPAPGFNLDPRACPDFQPNTTMGCLNKEKFHNQQVALRKDKRYGPYSVYPGSVFTATMNGTGDPDLYVGFDISPTKDSYDCRPYENGANESCDIDVPASAASAHIMVRGYRAGSYTLSLKYYPAKERE